jgi:hypothetical protein
LTDEQVAEACRLYPEGWSLARLAERFDVDDMTVRRYLLLAGAIHKVNENTYQEIDSWEVTFRQKCLFFCSLP